MKKIAIAMVLVALSISPDASADGALFEGFSLASAQSAQDGVKSSGTGFTGVLSLRPNQYYGYELQGGLFSRSGPFDSNVEVDVSVAGLLPLGDSGLKLYGKAGVADVYSSTSNNVTANTLGVTYGAGVEYQRNKTAIRVGFQHFNVGNNTLSPALSTNLVGVTILVQ